MSRFRTQIYAFVAVAMLSVATGACRQSGCTYTPISLGVYAGKSLAVTESVCSDGALTTSAVYLVWSPPHPEEPFSNSAGYIAVDSSEPPIILTQTDGQIFIDVGELTDVVVKNGGVSGVAIRRATHAKRP